MANDTDLVDLSGEGGGKKKGGGSSPVVPALLFLNAILMSGVIYFQFTSFQKRANEPSIKDVVKAEMKMVIAESEEDKQVGQAQEEQGILFPLKNFTANLAQGDGPRRFVRLNAVLKFSSDSKENEFKARQPQIRDKIISILNSKRPEDLLKVEGKDYLKEEIKAAINAFLIDGHVIDVYYVSFQIK